MAKCPKCGKRISTLTTYGSVACAYKYLGGSEWKKEKQEEPNLENEEYYCPKCGGSVALKQDEADTFLSEN